MASRCAPPFRVDLSAAVSKYLGETEKNRTRVVARDRHAKLESTRRRRRIERRRGLVVLAAKVREILDAAFVWRIGSVIESPPS